MISVARLRDRLAEKQDFVLLDVRTRSEFQDWRIPEAVNIPVQELPDRISEIPQNKPIVSICAHGPRSEMAADFLIAGGYEVEVVSGGMAAWNKIHDTVAVPLPSIHEAQLLQIRRLGKGCIGYLLVSKGEAAIIDPSIHTDQLLAVAELHNAKITKVLDTHQHADHLSGARPLAKATGAELYLSPLDTYAFPGFTPLKDNQTIRVGDVDLHVLHTPGHTKGSMSFSIQDKLLLTGDTLFVNGLARPDLRDKAQEFAADLYKTCHDRFFSLPATTDILPAHFNPAAPAVIGVPLHANLATIRKRLPMLELSQSEFIQAILKGLPPRPPNYETILQCNRTGQDIDAYLASRLEEGANRCVASF